ncbi:MAG: hypothetical protein ACE5MM_10045 [Nitrospiraceae bacterium]
MLDTEHLVEVDFNHAIIVDSQCLAESILRDFQAAIHIATERRPEVKMNRQGKILAAQRAKQRLSLGQPCQEHQDLATDEGLVPSSHCRQHTTAVHRGVLVVDARRYR